MSDSSLSRDDPIGDYNRLGDGHETLLKQAKFAALDVSIQRLQNSKKAFSDGQWALDSVFDFISELDANEQSGLFSDLRKLLRPASVDVPWQSRIALLRAWRDASSNNVAPAVGLANLYVAYAWDARGSDYADRVSEQAWKKFFARTRMAADALRAVEGHAEDCLAWFPTSLVVLKANQQDVGEWYAIFERGIRACPTHWHTYCAGADFHLERWSGSREQFADYLRRAVEVSRQYAGSSVAARVIVSMLDSYQSTVIADVREQDWGLIRAGFNDWIRAYPALSVANNFLMAARCFEDKATARSLIPLIGSTPYTGVWQSWLAKHFDGYGGVRAWAGM